MRLSPCPRSPFLAVIIAGVTVSAKLIGSGKNMNGLDIFPVFLVKASKLHGDGYVL